MNKDKRVYVYFNLHKKVWSVRQDGMVVKHTKHIMLKNCRFLVGKAGRERVLREGKKNVHAGVSGYVTDLVPACRVHSEVTYNPYRNEKFTTKDDLYEDVLYSDYAVLSCGNGWKDVEAIWE